MSCLVKVDFGGAVEFDERGILGDADVFGLGLEKILKFIGLKVSDDGRTIGLEIIRVLGKVIDDYHFEVVGIALHDHSLAVFKALGVLKAVEKVIVGGIGIVFGYMPFAVAV